MKKTLLFIVITLLYLSGAQKLEAQTYPPVAKIYGSSPFQDSLWALDASSSTYAVENRFGPFLPGFTITGMTGLAFDPCGFQSYIILKVSGVTGRVLATIDLSTMECTQVGNLGDNFSSIIFDRNGQLFGLTGNGATVPEAFYSIDKSDASKTFLRALGNGADGEVLCYDPVTDMFYHWSGNGTIVYEKFANAAPYTIIPISTSSANGEIFGALYLGPNQFLLSNISSSFNNVDTLGNYSINYGSNPDDLRGLIMPPVFAASTDTVCSGVESVSIASAAADLYTVIYHWGDGVIDTLASGIASHVYATSGNYSIAVELSNGYCNPDTFWTTSVVVNNIPLVSLSGNTVLCPGGSVLLTGSNGGSSQWYLNGSAIPGEILPSFSATTAGWYNMVKTNLNGCADSAAVGINLVDGLNPVVNIGNDTIVCGQLLLDAQNTGSAFLWNTSDTTQTLLATVSNLYSVTVTDTNGCSTTDDINLIVNNLPLVTLSGMNSICNGDSSLLSGSTGGTSQWYLDGVAIPGANSDTYYATQPGVYNMIKTNANGCSDSAAVGMQLVVNALPLVALSGTSVICNGDSSLLSGTSGGTSQWYLDGVAIAGATSDSYYASQTGVYNMIKTNANGCSDSAAVGIQFVVNALPLVTVSGTNVICIGDSSLLSGTSGGTSQWYLDGVAIVGATSDSYYASQPGIYNMIKTNANGCADSAAVGIALTVLPLPVVTYVELNDTVCTQQGLISLSPGNPVGGLYAGLFVAGNTFDAGLANSGAFTLSYIYTDVNGCSDSAASIVVVENCAGLHENSIFESSLLITPNPASAIVSVFFNPQTGNDNVVSVFNELGELVEQMQVLTGQTSLDISHYENGFYFLQVQSGSAKATKKLIVIH